MAAGGEIRLYQAPDTELFHGSSPTYGLKHDMMLEMEAGRMDGKRGVDQGVTAAGEGRALVFAHRETRERGRDENQAGSDFTRTESGREDLDGNWIIEVDGGRWEEENQSEGVNSVAGSSSKQHPSFPPAKQSAVVNDIMPSSTASVPSPLPAEHTEQSSEERRKMRNTHHEIKVFLGETTYLLVPVRDGVELEECSIVVDRSARQIHTPSADTYVPTLGAL
eukprot:2874777-Rhodomonas_salina.2